MVGLSSPWVEGDGELDWTGGVVTPHDSEQVREGQASPKCMQAVALMTAVG